MNVGFVDIDITETSSNIALRILTDHSIDMESFGAHGKTCVLLMVYLTKAVSDKARHYVFNNGHLNLYKMRSAKIANDMDHVVHHVADGGDARDE
ncbi:unnamed protein product [Urochloa humidicola]